MKGGESMKVGMLYQPMNLPTQSQKRVENRETNNNAGNFFQQLLLQAQENTSDSLVVNQAEDENALEQLLSMIDKDNKTDNTDLFNSELFPLIIENLPKNFIEKIVEQLRLEQTISQETEISEQKQAILMLLTLFQQGQTSAAEMDEQNATKVKHQLEAVLEGHLSMEDSNAMELIREFLVKLKNNKDNHFNELQFAGRLKDSQLHSKGSAETLRNLLYTNSYTIQHQLKSVMNQAETSLLENASVKTEIHGQMLTDYGMFTTSLQLGKGPIISLSESAPKTIMSQQFVQQFMKIMQTSKFTQLGSGQSQLIVRLHPEHLGSLTIKLVQENGELLARIIASTTSAKELIEANIQQIRHVIPAQNIIIEKFDVFTQQPFEQAFYDQQQERREQSQTHDNQKDRSEKENDRTFTNTFEEELLNLKA
jgi:flagellar hook-length control protein FliK